MEKDCRSWKLWGKPWKGEIWRGGSPHFCEQPSTNHDLTQKLCRCKTAPKTHSQGFVEVRLQHKHHPECHMCGADPNSFGNWMDMGNTAHRRQVVKCGLSLTGVLPAKTKQTTSHFPEDLNRIQSLRTYCQNVQNNPKLPDIQRMSKIWSSLKGKHNRCQPVDDSGVEIIRQTWNPPS